MDMEYSKNDTGRIKNSISVAHQYLPRNFEFTGEDLTWVYQNLERLMGLEEENQDLKAQIEELESEYLSEQVIRHSSELQKLLVLNLGEWIIYWKEHFNGLEGRELVDALIAKRIEFENRNHQDQSKMIPPIARGFVANPLDRVDELEARLSKLEADHNGDND